MQSKNLLTQSSQVESTPEQTAYVIGDGPGAHLRAIKLKQNGMKNVVMIGMRFNQFTRSASFNPAVFDKLSESLAPLHIKPSGSHHIKDAERQMHLHAKKLNITFITGEYECFENHNLKITTNDDGTLRIPFYSDDIVFDCTGTSRAVLKSINSEHKDKPIFEFTPIKNNPHKTYASIRMYYSPELLNVTTKVRTNFDPVSYAIAMEELRALGWKSYAVPRCHHYHQPSKKDLDKKTEKYVLYFQIPEIDFKAESKEEIEKKALQVAKILFKLFRNNPEDCSEPIIPLHKKSNTYPRKQIISVFDVNPCITTPSHYKGDINIPLTFHDDDATFPMPFVLGESFYNGIERTDISFENMLFQNGRIEKIDYNAFDLAFSTKLSQHSKKVEVFFQAERARIHKANKYAPHLYSQAYKKCKNLEDKEKIQRGLQQFTPEYIIDIFNNEIQSRLEIISDEKMGFQFSQFPSSEIFQKLESIIKEIDTNRKHIDLKKNETLKNTMIKIADACKKAGNHLVTTSQYSDAIQFYRQAIYLHQEYFHEKMPEELLNLYSNIMIVELKKGNFDEVIHHSALAKKIIATIDVSQGKNQVIVGKVYYNSANALLKKCQKYAKNKNPSPQHLIKLVNLLYSDISHITSSTIATKLRQEAEKFTQTNSGIKFEPN